MKMIKSVGISSESEDSSESITLRPRKRKRYLIIERSTTDVSDEEKKRFSVSEDDTEGSLVSEI